MDFHFCILMTLIYSWGGGGAIQADYYAHGGISKKIPKLYRYALVCQFVVSSIKPECFFYAEITMFFNHDLVRFFRKTRSRETTSSGTTNGSNMTGSSKGHP